MAQPSVLDHRTVSERYFFPRKAAVAAPMIVATDGVQLHCHRHIVSSEAPLLLHFHGNGEVVADWVGEWPQAFAARGVSTLLGEYRGYGGSTGDPQLARMLDDAIAIARQSGVPPARIVAYGRSIGSIYALHAAAELGLAGLVIESGIADVGERLLLRMRPGELGVSSEAFAAALKASFDHKEKIERVRAPVLVFHAEGDDLVPISHGERLAEWAGERGTLRRFCRGDHNTIHAYNGDEIVAEAAAFALAATAAA